MTIIEITENLRQVYNNRLRDFERDFRYPLGKDSFFIDHGINYFEFFDLLGTPYIYIAEEDCKIMAVAIIVLRNIDIYDNGVKENVWYICDLKIHPSYRGKFFIQHFIEVVYKKYSHLSSKIYGISMNVAQGENKLINLASRLTNLDLKLSGELNFYLLHKTQLNSVKQILIDKYNTINFVSLRGKKDLILTSTNNALNVVHFSSRKSEEKFFAESADKYMFCFPTNEDINVQFAKLDLVPLATASIISNIKNCNWNVILTSEI